MQFNSFERPYLFIVNYCRVISLKSQNDNDNNFVYGEINEQVFKYSL